MWIWKVRAVVVVCFEFQCKMGYIKCRHHKTINRGTGDEIGTNPLYAINKHFWLEYAHKSETFTHTHNRPMHTLYNAHRTVPHRTHTGSSKRHTATFQRIMYGATSNTRYHTHANTFTPSVPAHMYISCIRNHIELLKPNESFGTVIPIIATTKTATKITGSNDKNHGSDTIQCCQTLS